MFTLQRSLNNALKSRYGYNVQNRTATRVQRRIWCFGQSDKIIITLLKPATSPIPNAFKWLLLSLCSSCVPWSTWGQIGTQIFQCCETSRPILRASQLLTQWAGGGGGRGAVSRTAKRLETEADHLLSFRSHCRNEWSYDTTPSNMPL